MTTIDRPANSLLPICGPPDARVPPEFVVPFRRFLPMGGILCVPNALSQDGGFALGAQAGESAIADIVARAGFTRFRRAAETPYNLVFEARS